MFQKLSHPSRVARLLACTSTLIMALGLGGCQTSGLSDITGSIGEKADTSRAADPRREVELYQERYRANPRDADAALKYGTALRATGQRSQAVAVLEQASIVHPGDKLLLAAYGRALADNGNFQQAFDVLGRAHSPDDPDWRLLSAQGATLDQLGRYEEARQYYASALKIVPDHPSVLSNLGLSYVLSKDLPRAEETLRRAHSLAGTDPRVRANLALAVGLQGRVADAEKIVKADLPPAEAAANVAQLKQILARKDRENARAEVGKMPIAAASRSE
ncbi:tetratricopeptide repeat protein [Bradyrhizobium australiense]|uniref:Tetratricopeptide repeat protein n=1 Tax=Bradyrhizobium australiense TaxID=2721161 RepID=A0A7Y4LVS8_9BRAD|nr:tetratricopeptide repeat protein [Bradyrhizobium australiense]NOJ40364.1 tetratricopeptide repeat protein [Bradyrhizobium australiense]